MLTLSESRSGRPVRVGSARGLRLHAGGSPLAYLLADVIRRFAETRGTPVVVGWAQQAPPNAADLMLLPPTGGDPPYDLAIGDPDPGEDHARHWLACPEVTITAAPAGDWAAVRLALLRLGGAGPAILDEAPIEAAARLLARWRERVAVWANSPSKPMCAEYVARFRTALEEELNISRALDVLADLEDDPELPAGCKFETTLFLDRILALGLPSEIGRF